MRRRDRSTPREGRGQSQRQLKMGEQIRHILGEAVLREDLRDRIGQPISLTFTEVRCSADFRHAKAFYAPLGPVSQFDCEDALKSVSRSLQIAVAKGSSSKFTPRLTFIYDVSFDQADHLREILRGLSDIDQKEPSNY